VRFFEESNAGASTGGISSGERGAQRVRLPRGDSIREKARGKRRFPAKNGPGPSSPNDPVKPAILKVGPQGRRFS
jgi:hypothetical protein